MAAGDFMLVPLTAAHVQLDYDAVIESAVLLRQWSGTSWPADDFSIEANRDDLERHDREHRDGLAFTYTVLTQDQRMCLGCVYITPLATLIDADRATLSRVTPGAAVVGFWVRRSRLVDNLDERLLATLLEWFLDAWRFSAVFFSTKTADRRQRRLFREAGLVEQYEVRVPARAGRFLLHRVTAGRNRE